MTKIEGILKELNELEDQFKVEVNWSEDKLLEWHINCTSIFEAIGLRSSVIDRFSTLFNPHLLIDGEEQSLFIVTDYPRIFVTKTASIHLMTIEATFRHARKKIEIMEEEEKFVPAFISSISA